MKKELTTVVTITTDGFNTCDVEHLLANEQIRVAPYIACR